MDYFRSKRFLDTLEDWEAGTVPKGSPSEYLPRMRALLRRLDDPHGSFTSVIVGGTNGKGTVASLLASLLRAAGKRVGLYTSPHLHTVRERVRIDGEILEKDVWAEAVTALYDRTRRFETEGLGPFTRFEALTGLSASLFASAEVDYGVFEVGLGGRYDATNQHRAGPRRGAGGYR
jgi:dihydrofolate synthase/folylpolyglutamate synthase